MLTGWTYWRKITIDHTKVDENLTDYPVLVLLNSGNFDFTKARTDGYDIRFTAANGITLLSYERVSHDAVAQTAEYWVKIPTVKADNDTFIYVWYGNADAADGSTTGIKNYGVSFNGINQYGAVAHHASLSFDETQSYTIEFWEKSVAS